MRTLLAAALLLSACASTNGIGAPSAPRYFAQQSGWHPRANVPVKPDAPPRKRLYTGGGGLKSPTR